MLGVSIAQLRIQYAYTSSRVEDTGPQYTGDLRVGEQVFLTPYNTGGASLSLTPLPHTNIAASLTYVGEWVYYDQVAELRCAGGTGPCPNASRGFLTRFPGFVKMNVTVSQQLTRVASVFVSSDNVTNRQVDELTNAQAVLGRVTMAGVRIRY
jgi:hypothetical protein